jgi:alkylation response protein AidB-like acyl-CoA dehydrogenase
MGASMPFRKKPQYGIASLRKNQKNQFSIERKASGFIINGKKEFVVNGQIADSILLLSKGCGEDAEGCASLLCEPA